MAKIDTVSPAQISDALDRHPALLDGVAKAFTFRSVGLSGSVTTFLWAVMAEHNERRAAEFFDMLHSGVGMTSENHPILRLRNFLINLGGKRRARAEETAAVAIKAFNAFLETPVKEISHLRWVGAGAAPEPFPEVGVLKQPRRKK
jgi:hypothetical protein